METTNALTTPAVLEKKVEDLLSLQKITLKDVESLDSSERQHLGKAVTEILAELQDTERDDFLEKIAPIVDVNTKSEMWEYNHTMINNAITDFTKKYGFMPSKTKIAELSGLSRPTVTKHLKDYKQHPGYAEVAEQFKFMSHRVLSGVFSFATSGDMRAARLYFEMVGALSKQQPGTVVNAQNNYIQINNTILSQENLKQLTAEQLDQIESIVTKKAGS